MRLSKRLFWPTTAYLVVGALVGILSASVAMAWWGYVLLAVVLFFVFVAIDSWIDVIGEDWASRP